MLKYRKIGILYAGASLTATDRCLPIHRYFGVRVEIKARGEVRDKYTSAIAHKYPLSLFYKLCVLIDRHTYLQNLQLYNGTVCCF